MAWFAKNSKALKILVGVAGVTGGVYLAKSGQSQLPQENWNPNTQTENFLPIGKLPLGKVLASWTTNFKPSVPWDDNWDRRDPKVMVKPAKNDSEAEQENYKNRVKENMPSSTRHLILIRHGQYEMNHENKELKILTKLGRDQAELTGKRLKELNHPYNLIIHSTMPRARETAQIVHKSLPELEMKSCDLLREGSPIPPEPPVGHWTPEPHQFYQEGARIEAAFRKYFHRADVSQKKDSYEVYICHANVIRYFVCRALQLPPEAWLRMSLANASITWVTIRPSGRVCLRGLGDSGHMPKDKLTYT